uniref:dihydroorotase n=1 Tax=Flavobacterium sp. TaxID=239 RepID=UPI004049FB56
MNTILLKNATVVNEGKTFVTDVLIENERIAKIDSHITIDKAHDLIDLEGLYLLPGIIDDQVHFREPGLTHKGNIASESRAAAAGGITSFIEQPNTVPNAVTQEILAQKYEIASQTSAVNYSFMMGGTNNNLEELLRTNPKNVAGIKLFLGSSTGNMLVDNPQALESIFSSTDLLIAVHCEDETTIKNNLAFYKEKYGDAIPMDCHPKIRSEEACYLSSSTAIDLAKKTGARLHVFHLSTAKETDLFRNDIPLEKKRITAEVCIHHLWFSDADYATKGSLIKWNPAVKTAQDRDGLWKALLDDRIDVIATDHAPHTLVEKQQNYVNAPSGGPLVQHALNAMVQKAQEGVISLERVVDKMAHNPAKLFKIEDRGFIREGYFADLVVVDLKKSYTISKENIIANCGWSPFEGHEFPNQVLHTFVNGNHVYNQGILKPSQGKRLTFDR